MRFPYSIVLFHYLFFAFFCRRFHKNNEIEVQRAKETLSITVTLEANKQREIPIEHTDTSEKNCEESQQEELILLLKYLSKYQIKAKKRKKKFIVFDDVIITSQ
jgi:hypothetical protein